MSKELSCAPAVPVREGPDKKPLAVKGLGGGIPLKKFFMNLKILKHLFLYGLFGVLATLLDIFTYWFSTRALKFSTIAGAFTAWLVSMLFAFFTNKKFVFQSESKSAAVFLREGGYFFLCRIATGALEVGSMYIFVDLLGLPDMIIKIITNLTVIILNYVASKFFIFK